MDPPSRPFTPLASSDPDYQTAIPDVSMPQDLGDLLEGLGSDDLDDFELDGDALGEADVQSTAVVTNDVEKEEDAFFAPAAPPQMIGFTTAKGKALPPPSLSAWEKARKILEETEGFVDGLTPKRQKVEGSASTAAPMSHLVSSQEAPRGSQDSSASRHATSSFTTGSMGPVAPLSSDSRRQVMSIFGDEDAPALADASHRPFASFTNGRLDPLPPPSREALAKAAQILGDEFDDLPAFDLPDEVSQTTPYSKPFDRDQIHYQGLGLHTHPATSFVTGSGVALPPPNRSSIQKVTQLFDDEPAMSTPTRPHPSAFSTASGSSLPPPSASSQAAAMALLNDAASSRQPAAFHLASGGPAPISTSIRETAMSVFADTPSHPKAPSSRDVAMSILGEADAKSTPQPSRSYFPGSTSAQFRSPVPSGFRTPLRTTTNTFSTPSATMRDTKGATPAGRPIAIKTPTAKHLGSGRTPASRRGGTKRFVTPFKTPHAAITAQTAATAAFTPSRALPRVHDQPVFDLSDRQTMRERHLKPQYYTISELQETGLPDEIWQLDLTSARSYRFIADDASTLGPTDALQVLLRDGCRLATAAWVDNHWSMILWKLAGQVQAEPRLHDIRWNWNEVIEQLMYRYEREFGAAQRPIIRRIQERDSSAAIPMVLCVSAIHRPPRHADAGDETGAPIKPFLELTDGWYRVNAELDGCLARAVDKGRIAVGRKLAVCGARLESASEGEDVLAALNKSRLIISGNSTTLARWDAKLGAQEACVASLYSVSPDGGLISLMAVEVEKVFPRAFCHADKSASMEQPWDEAEEAIRADQWRRYESESTRLREESRAGLATMEDLVNILSNSAQEAEGTKGDSPSDDLDADFEALLAAKNPSGMLRRYSDSRIVHLARYAQSRMQAELDEAESEVQCQLATACPPRNIRNFRIVRLVDGIEGYKGHLRTALLTIWDAQGVDVVEKQAYLVSNLMPGRQGDWSLPKEGGEKKEIYLNTRRDTRWQPFRRTPSEQDPGGTSM